MQAGDTALLLAIKTVDDAHEQIVRMLVSECKADAARAGWVRFTFARTSVNFGQRGRTPLLMAAKQGRIELVRFLALEGKVNVNAQDEVTGLPTCHRRVRVVHVLSTVEYLSRDFVLSPQLSPWPHSCSFAVVDRFLALGGSGCTQYTVPVVSGAGRQHCPSTCYENDGRC